MKKIKDTIFKEEWRGVVASLERSLNDIPMSKYQREDIELYINHIERIFISLE